MVSCVSEAVWAMRVSWREEGSPCWGPSDPPGVILRHFRVWEKHWSWPDSSRLTLHYQGGKMLYISVESFTVYSESMHHG